MWPRDNPFLQYAVNACIVDDILNMRDFANASISTIVSVLPLGMLLHLLEILRFTVFVL